LRNKRLFRISKKLGKRHIRIAFPLIMSVSHRRKRGQRGAKRNEMMKRDGAYVFFVLFCFVLHSYASYVAYCSSSLTGMRVREWGMGRSKRRVSRIQIICVCCVFFCFVFLYFLLLPHYTTPPHLHSFAHSLLLPFFFVLRKHKWCLFFCEVHTREWFAC